MLKTIVLLKKKKIEEEDIAKIQKLDCRTSIAQESLKNYGLTDQVTPEVKQGEKGK